MLGEAEMPRNEYYSDQAEHCWETSTSIPIRARKFCRNADASICNRNYLQLFINNKQYVREFECCDGNKYV